jgi:hypothetical protein
LKKLVYYDDIGTALKWSDTFFEVFYLSLCQKCEKVGIIKELVGIMTGKVGIIGEKVRIMTDKVGIRSPAAISVRKTVFLRQVSA